MPSRNDALDYARELFKAAMAATEPICGGPPVAETVEPVPSLVDKGVSSLPDVHLARIERHRSLRRLAGELLPNYLPISPEERMLILSGAAVLVKLRRGEAPIYPLRDLPREAGQLFARLPDNPQAALKTLEILARLLRYIDDGVLELEADVSEAEAIEKAMVRPVSHLRLVEKD